MLGSPHEMGKFVRQELSEWLLVAYDFFNPIIMDKGKVMTMERVWQDFYDSQVRPSIEYPQIGLSQLLQTAVEENPSGTAAMFFGAKLSYRNLSQLVDQFARGLNSLGIEQGDRVALILPNLPVYPIAHFAIVRIGAIVVPTNPLYVERELEYQLNDSGARAAVVFDQLAPRLRSVQKQTEVKDVIVAGVQDFLPWPLSLAYRLKNRSKTPDTGNYLVYKKFMSRNYPEISPPEIDPQDTAILLYTGGTTGVSKGAELTHAEEKRKDSVCPPFFSQLRDDDRNALGGAGSIGDVALATL